MCSLETVSSYNDLWSLLCKELGRNPDFLSPEAIRQRFVLCALYHEGLASYYSHPWDYERHWRLRHRCRVFAGLESDAELIARERERALESWRTLHVSYCAPDACDSWIAEFLEDVCLQLLGEIRLRMLLCGIHPEDHGLSDRAVQFLSSALSERAYALC